MTDLDTRLRALDPTAEDAAPDREAVDELLDHVLALPVTAPSSRRRQLIAVAACVAAAAAVVVAVTVVTDDAAAPPSAGSKVATIDVDVDLVRFTTRKSGAVVARITNPNVGADQLTAAFAAEGLDIRVSAVPASPSAVGTVVFSDFDAQAIKKRGCTTGGGGACQVGFVVPAGFTGHGEAAVGRPARSGEDYASANSAFAKNEVLRCSGIVGERANGRTVAAALEDRGLTAEWSVRGDPVSTTGDGLQVFENSRLPAGSPAPEGFVRSATPLSATRVLISVGDAPPQTYVADLDRGC